MPDEVEVETKDLQETIQELQEERKEREEQARQTSWTRYIALTTAILAVFAAIGALQSGTLVNEAMLLQLRASDAWNEYQANRQKDHLYRISAFTLLDRGAAAPAAVKEKRETVPPNVGGSQRKTAAPNSSASGGAAKQEWKPEPAPQRLRQYIEQANKEADKETELKAEAERLERESAELMERHHQFARSVAFIQVAIALSAVAALTRMKSVWVLSLLVGLAGIAFFGMGLAGI